MDSLTQPITIVKISPTTVIIYFIFYILSHYLIGKFKSSLEEKLKKDPENEEIKKDIKNVSKLFKFYPMIYIVVVILLLL